MIVKLTKEQISILSFAAGMYMETVLDTMIPSVKVKFITSIEEIIRAFDKATEE